MWCGAQRLTASSSIGRDKMKSNILSNIRDRRNEAIFMANQVAAKQITEYLTNLFKEAKKVEPTLESIFVGPGRAFVRGKYTSRDAHDGFIDKDEADNWFRGCRAEPVYAEVLRLFWAVEEYDNGLCMHDGNDFPYINSISV